MMEPIITESAGFPPECCDVDLVVFKVLQVERLNVKRGESVVELRKYQIENWISTLSYQPCYCSFEAEEVF